MFMVGKLLRFGSIVAWILHMVACMGGCLGSATEPKLDLTIHDSLQQQKPVAEIHSRISKASISESFRTNSNCDMDVSAVQSQGSVSSVSSSLTNSHGAGSSNASYEFVNHGLLLWNQTRRQWIGSRKPEKQMQQLREPKLSTLCLCIAKKFWLCSWNATYDSLLGSNKPFTKRIPLAEMVDFLVDVWEQEGMYD
ncbi:uncharacterized protein LOC113767359 isoform X2 [Coffea eugenioides]|uniref:uncharacterized protein LOC113767359 isoform X2 n=1 Tax=Coffea eugenioides TaxID=49369 RepID=UPI000F6080B5|nr:uncharacterized protein LOC113767359 isoform X2 [Coffea eugenioides]